MAIKYFLLNGNVMIINTKVVNKLYKYLIEIGINNQIKLTKYMNNNEFVNYLKSKFNIIIKNSAHCRNNQLFKKYECDSLYFKFPII